MLFGLLLSLLLAPQAPDSFGEGNAHFAAGAYRDAHAAYHRALGTGQASAALYYNLGLTHARLDSLPRAVQFFEKARALAPDDPRIAHNLAFVRTRLGLNAAQQPEPYLRRLQRLLETPLSPFGWWGLGFGLVTLAASLVAWQVAGHPRAWRRRLALLCGAAGFACLALAFVLSLRLAAPPLAVALEDVLVRDSRGGTTTLRAGEVAPVEPRHEGPWQVTLPSGAHGPVPAGLLGPI